MCHYQHLPARPAPLPGRRGCRLLRLATDPGRAATDRPRDPASGEQPGGNGGKFLAGESTATGVRGEGDHGPQVRDRCPGEETGRAEKPAAGHRPAGDDGSQREDRHHQRYRGGGPATSCRAAVPTRDHQQPCRGGQCCPGETRIRESGHYNSRGGGGGRRQTPAGADGRAGGRPATGAKGAR